MDAGSAVVLDNAGSCVDPLVEFGGVVEDGSGPIDVPLGSYVPEVVLQHDFGWDLRNDVLAIHEPENLSGFL